MKASVLRTAALKTWYYLLSIWNEGVCETVDDLAVEMNAEIGNITAESEDNILEKTLNNPS